MSDNVYTDEIEEVTTESTEGNSSDEKETKEYEKFCALCHRPESVAGKMIELPTKMYVCQDCMQKGFDMMNKGGFDYSQLMNMPGVQILNMSDFENMMPKQQQIKEKTAG